MSTAVATPAMPTQSANGSQLHERKPLWEGQEIPIIGVTGDFSSGKTMFSLLISPRETIEFDAEKSGQTYQSGLGFTRVDIPAEMSRLYPTGNYQPIHVFQFWLERSRALKPGQFRVMVVDDISAIEDGLVQYVRKNPTQFGYSERQFAAAESLVWGAVKSFWKQILADLSTRVETVVLIAHLRDEFKGGKPTGRREPKGKETIFELSTLYLWLERKPDEKGKVPAKPRALVLKSRLSAFGLNEETGEMEPMPALPPVIPDCSPAAIRHYIRNPPNYAKLKADERIQTETLSAEQRLLIEAQIASDNAKAAEANLQRVAMNAQRADQGQALASAPVNVDQSGQVAVAHDQKVVAAAATEAATQSTEQPPFDVPGENTAAAVVVTTTQAAPLTPTPGATSITEEQAVELKRLREAIGTPIEKWRAFLAANFKVESALQLTHQQAEALIVSLRRREEQKKVSDGINQFAAAISQS